LKIEKKYRGVAFYKDKKGNLYQQIQDGEIFRVKNGKI